jgi:hypothetical protein
LRVDPPHEGEEERLAAAARAFFRVSLAVTLIT